jgi:high-affinity iron transporter
MLTTLIIALREGLEAALIVGIVAAFLTRNGDRESMRAMWVGVTAAIVACFGVATGLYAAGQRLPFRGREIMEGTLALVAVAGVTYMIVWMKRNARGLRPELEQRAGAALAQRSSLALVAMAFLAVIREGLETAVFLLATLAQATSAASGAAGAVIGLAVAIGIGYGIYRGGVEIDLARFFKVTSALLVLVAAGLVSAAFHAFTEAGLIGFGTRPALDLSWLIAPGTVRAGLVTGVLGIEPVPTYVEIGAWLAFFAPMLWFVLHRSRGRSHMTAA